MKLKLFTHNDLDGIGNIIIAQQLVKYGIYEELNFETCSYIDINSKTLDYLNNPQENTMLLFTDISVSDEVAQKIDKLDIEKQLLDHHRSALELNKYSWCNVEEIIDGTITSDRPEGFKNCGTKMFFDAIQPSLTSKMPKESMKTLMEFVNLVREYDTWEWEANDNLEPKRLNDLLFMKGQDKFITSMLYKIDNGLEVFSLDDLNDLYKRQIKINKYIDEKEKFLVEINIKGLNAGVVIAENYISELASTILKRRIDLEILVILNGKTASLRTRRNNIDLSKLAEEYGGGGHQKASGFTLTPKMLKLGYNKMFNGDNWERFENK